MAISEAEKSKAVGQFKLQLNGILEPFNQYGMDVHIPAAVVQITELAILLAKRYNGQDIPITLQHAESRRRKRRK